MDFSALNPNSSNPVNIAARHNNIRRLRKLLRKHNPNSIDNRGWTCLHEAAANDHYESLDAILRHKDCRPLAETFEGHTALYIAVKNRCSQRCIKLLLDRVKYIAQYASNEMVSPLHVACLNQDLELVELLLQYNSIIDLQDFDGDTPLHEAAIKGNSELVALLLHAGAIPDKKNHTGLTPFHMACGHGLLNNVKEIYPFIIDIDDNENNLQATPLVLASKVGETEIVNFLLSKNADPNIADKDGNTALIIAMIHGHAEIFRALLQVTDPDYIAPDILRQSCLPLNFQIDVFKILLESDLDNDFFNRDDVYSDMIERLIEPVYRRVPPLHYYLRVADYVCSQSHDLFLKMLYIVLMRGVAVNALYVDECPPLVYFHYCYLSHCYEEMIDILVEHGCNIDYVSVPIACGLLIPDIMQMSVASESKTTNKLLEYSIWTEPEMLITHALFKFTLSGEKFEFLKENFLILSDQRKGLEHLKSLLELQDSMCTLQHLCRLKIREILRNMRLTTAQYLKIFDSMPLPQSVISFLRYKV